MAMTYYRDHYWTAGRQGCTGERTHGGCSPCKTLDYSGGPKRLIRGRERDEKEGKKAKDCSTTQDFWCERVFRIFFWNAV